MKTTLKGTVAVVLLIGLQGMTKAEYSHAICPNPGLQCDGCKKAVDCEWDDRQYRIMVKFTNETCPGEQVCDSSKDATCSAGAICRYKKFECPYTSKRTVFPDPYSCLEYHLCTNGKQLDIICIPGESFRITLGLCDHMKDPKKGCSNPIPPCMKAGDKGEVGDYEWECMEETSPLHTIYPKLTKKGDLTTTSSGTTPTTTTSSGSTTTPPASSTPCTPTPGTTQAPVTCTTEGTLADKDCCNCYYLWYLNEGELKLEHMCCRDGSHFEGTRCVAGSCSHPSTCVRT